MSEETSARRYLPLLTAQLNLGTIEERPLVEHQPSRRSIRGYCSSKGVITVNPIPDILDTLIHECFHRAFPGWSERTVKARTTELIRRLTPEEQQSLYTHYLSVRRRVRRKKAVQ